MASLCNVWVNEFIKMFFTTSVRTTERKLILESRYIFSIQRLRRLLGLFLCWQLPDTFKTAHFYLPMEQREVGTLIIRQFLNSIFYSDP